MTEGAQAVKYLEAQTRKITVLLPRVTRQIEGAPVHQLRLATRRVRAALWVLRHSSVPLEFPELEQKLYDLGRALGQVRELDVAIEDAVSRHIDPLRLVTEHEYAKFQLRVLISPQKQQELLSELVRTSALAHQSEPLLAGRADKKLKAMLKDLSRHRIHGSRRLHRLRIGMKKIRYILEALGRPVKPLKPLLDALGRGHDLDFLRNRTSGKSKLKLERRTLNRKCLSLIPPAIRYATKQIERYGRHAEDRGN